MIEQQEYKRIVKKLKEIEFALDVSSIVAIANKVGKITYANDIFCEISKYTREELMGQDHNILNSGYHTKAFFKDMWKTIGSGKVWKGEIRNKAKDGTFYWVYTTIVPFLDENGRIYQYVSIRNDITKEKEYAKKIEYDAYHDEITGLPNKRFLDEELEATIEAHRTFQKQFAILFLDLDNFKTINDTVGHGNGDLLLEELARRLKKLPLEKDTIFRRSGDEFVILLKNILSKKEIEKKVELIFSVFDQSFANEEIRANITGSIGVSIYPRHSEGAEELLEYADVAMYEAKRKGKNYYVFYDGEMALKAKTQFHLAEQMKKDLTRGRFELYYQPQIDAETKTLCGMEALLRWKNEEGQFISPEEFIPVAEETGIIHDIGLWVLQEAISQNKNWQEKGYEVVPIAVNVSNRQLDYPHLSGKIKNLLQQYDLDPALLHLEITESCMMEGEKTLAFVKEVREHGIQVAIDDFGTGYSALQYLADVPLDYVKIDRAFVRHLEDSETRQRLLRGILFVSKALNMKTVAEGVENEAQYNYLKSQQCDTIQGYYFSKPLPKEIIEKNFFQKEKCC